MTRPFRPLALGDPGHLAEHDWLMRQFPAGSIVSTGVVNELFNLFDPNGIDDIVIPPGEWITSQTLIATNRVIRAAHHTSKITYIGTGVAIEIETNDAHHRLPLVAKAQAWGSGGSPDRTSVGVRIRNANDNTVHLAGVYGFYTGLDVHGDNDGCCFNEIHPGKLVDNMLGLFWSVNGTGWVNSNTFIGGRAVLTSSVPAGVIGSRGVMGGQGTGTGERAGNGNTVIGLGLESNRWEFSVELSAPYNTFVGCRFEDASPIMMRGATSYDNLFVGGYAIIDDDRYGPYFFADTANGRLANAWLSGDGDAVRRPIAP